MRANVSGKKIDSIRVDTGVKKIEVNDEGETISLNFADQSFPARYFAMVDEFQAQQDVFRQVPSPNRPSTRSLKNSWIFRLNAATLRE